MMTTRRTLAALLAAVTTIATAAPVGPARAITCGGTVPAGETWPPRGGTNCDSAHVAPPTAPVSPVADGLTAPLHWDQGWTGGKMGCPPGYQLTEYHYDCNCSNSATWFGCVRSGIDTTAFPAGTSTQKVD